MLGAGVFVVWGPAAAAAGAWLPLAVVLAAAVALVNALSTAHLAALHPVAGGAYTYGARELRGPWGFIAGAGFVTGKTASLAAMALAIGGYTAPRHAAWVATGVLLAASWVNARGVTRTAAVTTMMAALVVVGLGVLLTASLFSPAATTPVPHDASVAGIAEAAALVFFAFAGYARVATLGEEVREPARIIPRAVIAAVGVVVALYVALAFVVLRRPGVEVLADADAPLVDAAPAHGPWPHIIGLLAVVAAGGALVALLAGVGRTAMAMARDGEIPRILASQSSRGVPVRAEAVGVGAAIVLVWWGDVGFAIAMSSVAVLTYYAVANAAAYAARSRGGSMPVPRVIAAVGVVICLVLAVSVDPVALASALTVMALLVAWRAWIRRRAVHPTGESSGPQPPSASDRGSR